MLIINKIIIINSKNNINNPLELLFLCWNYKNYFGFCWNDIFVFKF